jgi:hypothetical protein
MAGQETYSRPPARVIDHLEESSRMLKERGYPQIQLLGSFPSYMTGLMFHKYEEKPEEHKVYLCLPEPSNPHDPQALGILSSQNKRIAFVPRIMSEHFAQTFPGVYSGVCMLVAYCIGYCTPKSAQCIYNVYQIIGATPFIPQLTTSPTSSYIHVPPPPPSQSLRATCTICKEEANRFIRPCGHYACCVNCTSRLFGLACPSCQTTVTGFAYI